MSASSNHYPPGALPIGTRLGEFEVRRVLGIGGFGIVYHAFDHLLERDVAVKEYMPATLAGRTETQHVSLLSQSNADTFALGLRSFVNEARLLARFDHPSLVKVHRFWEGNGTAYMAMALYRGRNARDVRASLTQRPDEGWLRSLLEPLLGAIEKLHSEDVYHRDIAPDNIIVEPDGRPVLLDFGAARRVITDRSQTLTAILKPSYAPIEQYADTPGLKQGPWTDIYALGATMHFLLIGRPPPPAPARTIQDMLPRLTDQGIDNSSTEFLALVDWMLAPRPDDRPQSVAVLRDALAGRITPPRRAPPPADPFSRPADDDDGTLPPVGQRARPPAPNPEATQVVPRSAMPPRAPDFDSEATVMIPRTGMPPAPPPRTSMPAMGNDFDHPTIRVARPGAPAEPDPDATVVTHRHTMAPARTFQAAPPPPPVASPPRGATAMPPVPPPPRSQGPVRPAPVTTAQAEFKSATPSWLIPAALGAVLTVGLAIWLWPSNKPIVKTQTMAAPAPAPAPPSVVVPPAPVPTAAMPAPEPAPAPAAAPETVRPAPPETTAVAPPAARPAPPLVKPAPPPVRPPVAIRPTSPADTTAQRPSANPPVRPTPDPSYGPATAPAPVPAPAPPMAVVPAAEPSAVLSPSDRCRRQLPLVKLICIDVECGKAELAGHPECVKLRADQERSRNRTN